MEFFTRTFFWGKNLCWKCPEWFSACYWSSAPLSASRIFSNKYDNLDKIFAYLKRKWVWNCLPIIKIYIELFHLKQSELKLVFNKVTMYQSIMILWSRSLLCGDMTDYQHYWSYKNHFQNFRFSYSKQISVLLCNIHCDLHI